MQPECNPDQFAVQKCGFSPLLCRASHTCEFLSSGTWRMPSRKRPLPSTMGSIEGALAMQQPTRENMLTEISIVSFAWLIRIVLLPIVVIALLWNAVTGERDDNGW